MANFLITINPMGTPDELREAGISPLAAGSCSKHTPENIGCSYWTSCVFRDPANGGFCGQGPKNIGYYLRVQEGAQKEDWMSCFEYMHTLHSREQAQDKTGEKVFIVAQEGEEITRAYITPEEPVTNNKTGNLRMKNVVETIKVPAFPRLKESQPSIDYERKLIENRKNRMAAARRREAGFEEHEEAPVKRGPGRPPRIERAPDAP